MSWWSRQIRGYSCGKESGKCRGKMGEKGRGKYAVKLPRREKTFCRDFVASRQSHGKLSQQTTNSLVVIEKFFKITSNL
jgi:hypothetical protein